LLERIMRIEPQLLAAEDIALASNARQNGGAASNRGLAQNLSREGSTYNAARNPLVAGSCLPFCVKDREVGRRARTAGRAVDPAILGGALRMFLEGALRVCFPFTTKSSPVPSYLQLEVSKQEVQRSALSHRGSSSVSAFNQATVTQSEAT
jgi:hypothetical protein